MKTRVSTLCLRSSTAAAFSLPLLAWCLLSGIVEAAVPFDRAEISLLVGTVQIQDGAGASRPARLRDVIGAQHSVRTGDASRAELLFPDHTVTRLGAQSIFRLGTRGREIQLERGVLLLQTPKGAGGATIRTATVTATVMGTNLLFEYSPGRWVKLIAFDDLVWLTRNNRWLFPPKALVRPGYILFFHPNANQLPKPTRIDLSALLKTSPLLDPDLGGGGAPGQFDLDPIRAAIDLQAAGGAGAPPPPGFGEPPFPLGGFFNSMFGGADADHSLPPPPPPPTNLGGGSSNNNSGGQRPPPPPPPYKPRTTTPGGGGIITPGTTGS